MRFLYLWSMLIFLCLDLRGQTVGDYQTTSSGNWSSAGIWERFDGVNWVPAVTTPTDADGEIRILIGHTVTIPNGFSVTANQLVLINDLVIASGGTLILTNGTGTDLSATSASSLLQVFGTLQVNQGATLDNQSVASRISFLTGSNYRHNYTTSFGSLPVATWSANSTVTVQGFTNTTTITAADNSWGQPLGNFVYNCPNQKGTVDFAGELTDINGNFSVTSTGANSILQLSSNQGLSMNIDGNLTISGTSRVNFSSAGIFTLDIGGDWNHISTNLYGTYLTSTGNATITVNGDFFMDTNTGRLHLANTGTTGVGTINFHGDFNLVTGRIDENGSEPTHGNLRFVGTSQKFANTGTITTHINYYISPSTTLDMGTSPVTGSSSAFVLDGGVLVVGSLDPLGAIQTTTTGGNIRTTNVLRTYADGSTIIYRGTGAQFMNTGQPSAANIVTIIDNANDVSLAANVTINGALQLDEGSLNLAAFTLTSGGTLVSSGGTFAGTSSSGLVIQGTTGGNWGTITFDPAANVVGTLTINRTGASAGAVVNGSLQVSSQLNLTRGNLNNVTGLSMQNGAIVTRYNTSSLLGTPLLAASGNFNVIYRTFSVAGGPYANFNTGLELPSNATSLGGVGITTAQTQDVVNLSSNITLNGDLILAKGTLRGSTFTVTMQGANWTDNAGNFDPSTGTVIFNGVTTLNGISNPTFHHLQLNTTRSLTIARSFSVSGNITFANGSIFTMPSTVSMTLNGSTLQTVSVNGAAFSNINIAKPGSAGVQLSSPMGLSGLLQFSSPSSNVNVSSNGFLTLLSTSDAAGTGTGTGMIYRLLSGNTVSGNVTVQRYMSGEGQIYRYISVPVSGAMVSQWKDDFDITGPFNDPSPRRVVCGVSINPANYSLFYYNEAVPGDINQGYVGYPLTGQSTTNSPIVVGRGYATFIRECSNPTIIDVTGPINQVQAALPVTYTVNTPAADGWNLVGNPFPCTIDWDGGSWTKTRISPVISITDNGTGMIRYYEAGVTNDIPNGHIAPGQAFFARATGANPSLVVRESSKVGNVAEFFREGTPSKPSFALAFSDGQVEDRAYVKLEDEATGSLDDFDAPKINNPTFSFSTISDDQRSMAINALNALPCGKELKIGMKGVQNGQYSVSLELRGIYFKENRFSIIDHFLNKATVIKPGQGYSFLVTDHEASRAFDRFSLLVEQNQSASLEVNTLAHADGSYQLSATTNYPSAGAKVFWYETETSSAPLFEGESFETPVLQGPQTYYVELVPTLSCSNARKAVRVGSEESSETILGVSCYPNPVRDRLKLSITDPAIMRVEFITVQGKQYRSMEVQPGQYSVDLSELSRGVYLMVVVKKDSKKSIRLYKD